MSNNVIGSNPLADSSASLWNSTFKELEGLKFDPQNPGDFAKAMVMIQMKMGLAQTGMNTASEITKAQAETAKGIARNMSNG
jgi:hypothetical protein